MPKPKFLADENIPPTLVAALRHEGFDVIDLKEEGKVGLSDLAIAQWAKKDKRVILTFDKDFLHLLRDPLQAHPGLILLRYSDQRPHAVTASFLAHLEKLLKVRPHATLTIVSDTFVEVIR